MNKNDLLKENIKLKKEKDILYHLLNMTVGEEQANSLFSRAQLEYAIQESNLDLEYRWCHIYQNAR